MILIRTRRKTITDSERL